MFDGLKNTPAFKADCMRIAPSSDFTMKSMKECFGVLVIRNVF